MITKPKCKRYLKESDQGGCSDGQYNKNNVSYRSKYLLLFMHTTTCQQGIKPEWPWTIYVDILVKDNLTTENGKMGVPGELL